VWPATAYLVWRSRWTKAIGDRLLWSSLVTFTGLLLLVDQTKTPLYAIILLPSLCMALAVLCTGVWSWARTSGRRPWITLASRALIASLGIVVATDGVRAYQVYLAQAAQVSHYLGVGLQLEGALSSGSRILGPERWWWALHDHPYASLRSVWWQWQTRAEASADQSRPPQFADWVGSLQADTIIVNDNIRDDVRSFPDALQRQFWAFVSMCTTQALELTDAFYLRIEVDRIVRPPPELEVCGRPPS
jgi:hypothetical protein